MANPPIGKLDHIGIAVKSVAEARKFFDGVLGATFVFEAANEAAGFTLAAFDLNGLSIELLEPLGATSFLHKFLEKRGEGMHHLTFNVPDCKH
ncbi:MAG: VOC family protein, partial [Candidatus Binatus sp.]